MPPWISETGVSDCDQFPDPLSPAQDLVGDLPEMVQGKLDHHARLGCLPARSSPSLSSVASQTAASEASDVASVVSGDKARATASTDAKRLEIRLPKSTLAIPRYQFDGWVPPAPVTKERIALSSLMEVASQTDLTQQDFIDFDLDHFSIYVRSVNYPCELRPLQHLCTKSGGDEFYFDGVLSVGDVKFYLSQVPFRELPIGNYGTSHPTIGDQIWIRSRANSKKEVYYRLKRPATEYERFHIPFLWIADLAKHVVDFCAYMVEGKEPVTIRHFQQTFMDWLREAHGKSPTFQRWHKQHGRDDFRTAVTANVEFIWKEVIGVLGHRAAHSLQLFREIKHFTQYQPFASVLGDKRNPVQPPTVVTPYVFKCFGHCEFGGLLEPLQSADDSGGHSGNDPEFKAIEDVQQEEESAIQLVASDTRRARTTWSTKDHQLANRKQMIEHIKPGDTISTPPDGAGSGTKWKTEVAKGATEERRWFGLVQKVHVSEKKGTRTFDVTWLYRPVDTPCCKMLYPWSKELFLSDHCTCQGGRDARVDEDEVLAVHKVDWFGTPETTTAEFFVRQTYEVEHRRWVALEKQHMTCAHNKQEHLGYRSGDTVLATVSGNHDRAEAYEIVKVFRQGQNKFIRLRRLVRRSEFEIARPNELVYTDHMEVVKPYRILGKCIVRFFAPGEPVPCPYDRNGTANVFLITHKLENGVCLPLADRPQSMRQGFDPNQPVKKLRGLDLFCGSGNFGRGLEEGGVVDMCWTNDIWTEAVHTYMANGSAHTKPFLGSVDDLLRLAIEGNHGSGIPRRGDVDFISGGSPCQGFSLITSDRTQDRQKKNRSLVASFASFVEFYRPKYGILENVLNIVQTGQNRDEDAFSQLICAIVGMGYQTQLILGDAWTYGAPQSRSRAFLYFAAPGQRLPEPPRPSHSHFKGVNRRGLGKMTQGESFVKRSFNITPFKFVSAAEATADLPEIHDAKPDYCIGYPDHRPSIGVTTKSRHQYARIPIQPYGMNFVKTWNNGNGVMTPSERELFPPSGLRVSPISHGWGRVQPNGVFHTITTSVTPTDARTGRFLHWRENRPITILEARRAQGFLDHEVLTGSPVAQYELVGNSVARPMALALGLQFREAWLESLYDDQHVPRHGRQTENSVVTGIDLYVKDEEELEIEWEDGGSASMEDTPDLRVGNATPATSVSESEAKVLASRKRSLSRSLAVDLHVSKARKVEVEHSVNEGGADAVILDKESPKRDGYAVLNPSNELVVPAS